MKKILPCVFITLALILAGSFLPVTGLVGIMLSPLPLCVLGCLEGHKTMSIAELLIEASLFIMISPMMAVYFLVGAAPVSAFIFMLSREEFKHVKKYSGPESLLIIVGVSIISKLILLLIFWFVTGKNILFPDLSQMNEIIAELYKGQPELQEALKQALEFIPYLMPSMLVIYSIIEAFLNYSLCGKFAKRISPQVKHFPPELPEFKLWRFPVSLIFALVFAAVFRHFVNTDEYFEVSAFVMNLQIVIDALMFVNGLALVFWLMSGFKFRKASKVFTCIILSIPFFWPFLMVMGMGDSAMNFRERIKF